MVRFSVCIISYNTNARSTNQVMWIKVDFVVQLVKMFLSWIAQQYHNIIHDDRSIANWNWIETFRSCSIFLYIPICSLKWHESGGVEISVSTKAISNRTFQNVIMLQRLSQYLLITVNMNLTWSSLFLSWKRPKTSQKRNHYVLGRRIVHAFLHHYYCYYNMI